MLLAIFSALALGLLFITDLLSGSVSIPPGEVIRVIFGGESTSDSWETIIMDIRLPKAITAMLAGAGLAVGGLLTQSLFRNPLNGPDVLGLSSGAGLGVAIAIVSGIVPGGFSLALAAFAGSSLTFIFISQISKSFPSNGVLIAGIMFSAFASSLITLLQYYSGAEELQRYTLWTLGSVSGTTWGEIPTLTMFVTLGLLLAGYSAKGLDAIGLSSGYAQSLGIKTGPLRWNVLMSTALITGAITAFCGPITFIGIAGPHIVRMIARTNAHHKLIPLSAISGAILVLLCDVIASIPESGTVLPINTLTALVGAPVVIWVIYQSSKRQES
jgi:iron complex transport system permease protein